MLEKEEHWTIEYWKNSNGNSPVSKFFDSLKKKEKWEHAWIALKLKRLQQDFTIDRLKQCEEIEHVQEHDLWEFKIKVRRREFRMLGALLEHEGTKPKYYALHCFWKKDQKIKNQEFITAKERLKEFKSNLII